MASKFFGWLAPAVRKPPEAEDRSRFVLHILIDCSTSMTPVASAVGNAGQRFLHSVGEWWRAQGRNPENFTVTTTIFNRAVSEIERNAPLPRAVRWSDHLYWQHRARGTRYRDAIVTGVSQVVSAQHAALADGYGVMAALLILSDGEDSGSRCAPVEAAKAIELARALDITVIDIHIGDEWEQERGRTESLVLGVDPRTTFTGTRDRAGVDDVMRAATESIASTRTVHKPSSEA